MLPLAAHSARAAVAATARSKPRIVADAFGSHESSRRASRRAAHALEIERARARVLRAVNCEPCTVATRSDQILINEVEMRGSALPKARRNTPKSCAWAQTSRA